MHVSVFGYRRKITDNYNHRWKHTLCASHKYKVKTFSKKVGISCRSLGDSLSLEKISKRQHCFLSNFAGTILCIFVNTFAYTSVFLKVSRGVLNSLTC